MNRYCITGLEWSHPNAITNAIIDIDPLSLYDIGWVARELDSVGCKALQIRIYQAVGIEFLSQVLQFFERTGLRHIELLISHNEDVSEEDLIGLCRQYVRINAIAILGSRENRIKEDNRARVVITTVKKDISSAAHCGLGVILIKKTFFLKNIASMPMRWGILLLLLLLKGTCYGQSGCPAVEHFLDKGDSAYERESFLAAGRYYSRAFAVNCRKLTQHEFYKAATSYAQAGAMDSAFLFFDRFLNRFNYFEYGQLQQDSNLIRLWKDPRWAVLVDRVRTNFARAEEHFNKPVKMELDTIYEDDQKYRRGIEEAEKKYGFNTQQAEALEDKMVWQDSINLSKVVSILDRYGWLGRDSVGFHGSFTLFIVLQHADLETQQKYLPIMRLAVKAGSARASDLAYLEDRVALDEGKKQIYGSQVRYNQKTGKYAFAPIRDEKNVNVRRRKVGLEPLETYAHSYNIQYKVPTN